MKLVDVVVDVHDCLEAAGIAHAFGGALSLGFVVDPRTTNDIDVNVFLPHSEVDRVVAALGRLGYRRQEVSTALPVAGVRVLAEGGFPVDLFPSLRDGYEEVRDRIVEHPFGAERRLLPFLSPEDLVVFKVSFNRDSDWVDLRRVAAAQPELDVDYVERKVVELRGPTMYPRVARLRSMFR
jgi:hypothetical protein